MSAGGEDFIKLNALRVEALYNNSATPVAVTLTGCVVLFFVLLNKQNLFPAILWLTLLLIVSAIRYYTVMRYHASSKAPENYNYWLTIFLTGTICSGTILGSTAYIFIVGDDIINAGLLTMFILVLNSGSIGIYSAFMRVYYGYNIPAILPLIVYMLSSNNVQLNKLGIIFIAFIVFIFVIQYHAHRIMNQMISVKLDNRNLLDSYEHDQSKLHILERMYNTNLQELKVVKNELASCREKLKRNNE